METFDSFDSIFLNTASDNALQKYATIVEQYSGYNVFVERCETIDQHYRELKIWRGRIVSENNDRAGFVFLIVD